MIPLIPVMLLAVMSRIDDQFEVSSPNGRIKVEIRADEGGSPYWSARFDGKSILAESRLGLAFPGEGNVLKGGRLKVVAAAGVDRRIPVLFGKSSQARDHFNELRIRGAKADVLFRCFDDAIAFRYEIPKQIGSNKLTLAEEVTSFGIADNPMAYAQYLENYTTSHEHNVSIAPVSNLKTETLMDLPLTFQRREGVTFAITEAALRRWAGMSLTRREGNQLDCRLTPNPDGTKVVTKLPAKSPWRVVLIGDHPGALLESNTLYCLNEPNAIGDTSWIKSGKMTWPWWNGHLVESKPTIPILSMEAAKRYIDFCAENQIAFHAYVSDENDRPWYEQKVDGLFPGPGTDVTKVRADLNLPAIRKMAEAKGIRLWTWVHQGALRGRNIEEVFAAFEKMGWAGMMIDFFDHDDQDTVEFAEEILKAAAKHHILIHFHGIWKPTGWQRTYPNLMNHEGALNLEYLKWGDSCSPEHDLLLAFTRLIAGPMDYHLGGFRTVQRKDFKPTNVGPNVLGTRCHMLAMYVCWDNPNPMVADYPEAYRGQPGFEFIKSVPTWWDETRVLDARIGERLVTARRKGKVWYVGGMGAKQAQDLLLPLSFLGRGAFMLKLWKDTEDPDSDPNHLKFEVLKAKSSDSLNVHLKLDGGFVAEIKPL